MFDTETSNSGSSGVGATGLLQLEKIGTFTKSVILGSGLGKTVTVSFEEAWQRLSLVTLRFTVKYSPGLHAAFVEAVKVLLIEEEVVLCVPLPSPKFHS